jgi:hypothetical protein
MEDTKKIQYDASLDQIGLGIEYPTELDAKRRYAVGCYAPEDWDYIHEVLTKDGTLEDNIPGHCIDCADIKEHSSTRAVYLLNNQEVEDLKNHPKVKYVNEDFASYPIKYKPNPDDLKATAIRNYRYPDPGTRQYRNWYDYNQIPATSGIEEYNRSGYQLLRMQEKNDVWYTGVGAGSSQIFTNRLQYYGDGSDVDVIVGDEGCWFGHVEFQSNSTAGGPTNYVGGNILKAGFSTSATTGTCDLLDLCLDAPYYIDPEWFEASEDPEYNNGAIINVTGDGSDFFKREVTVNGVRVMAAGGVGGQTAVPDAWVEKVARMFELFTDPNGAGINSTYQRNLIKNLSGDTGTYHAGLPTIQRVARGAGADYSTNFLTDAGIIFWNLTNLFDTHVQNDMVWYLNSTGDGYGDGDIDAQEVIEHVFHTLHMHGLPADDIKLYQFLAADWADGDLYAAMEEAYDADKWDPSGYQNPADDWKTDADAFEVAAKEYLFLLNFAMFEYTELWDGGSLAPEWTDDMRTQAGIQANNPLGYAFHNTYIAPGISKPSLATIRSIFQDGNTPAQDDPSLAGASGYNVTFPYRLTTRWDGTTVPVESVARSWWGDANQRSVGFSTIGTISITSNYTRSSCLGSNTIRPTNGTDHGTDCAANTYGRTQGWAFNCNKWSVNAYGNNGTAVEQYFDMMKLFHLYKPINSQYGTKDPTISSNSWGYRSTDHRTTGFYFYRQGLNEDNAVSGTSYTSATLPGFMNYVGTTGDSNRMKGEHVPNSYLDAGAELIAAGVIFIGAAGNGNQKQVSFDHPDYNNYWTTVSSTSSFSQSTHSEFGVTSYNSTNRRGFPQQLGKFTNGNGDIVYPVINIGALDDSFASDGRERKVNYSDMGNEIDCYAPADGTLSARGPIATQARPDTYTINYPSGIDAGVTLIANTNTEISGTSEFRNMLNKAVRITTTDSTTGTATTIALNLQGSAGLSSVSTAPTGSNDDGYWAIQLPFNIEFAGITTISTIYPGTNSYITFIAGSTSHSGFSVSNPALPKIMISSADNSAQRIYYGESGTSPNRTFRIRFEGTSATSGTVGNPNMVYEATFYEAIPSQIDVHVGSNNRVLSGDVPAITSYDRKFSGTSSACPVACGLIATKLQHNRSWTYADVRTWLQGSVGVGTTTLFDSGVESTTANAGTWSNMNSLEGGPIILLWDALTGNEPQEQAAALTLAISGSMNFTGITFT